MLCSSPALSGSSNIFAAPITVQNTLEVWREVRFDYAMLDAVFATTSAELVFTDNTQEGNTNAGTAFTAFPTGAVGDRMYLGQTSAAFNGIYFDVSTAGNAGAAATWEGWTGAAWVALTVTDGTAVGGISLRQDGSVTWTDTLALKTVNGVSGYFIRLRATAIYTSNPTIFSEAINRIPIRGLLLQERALPASTAFNASGTYYAANAPTGFNGDFVDYQLAGISKFRVGSSGDGFFNGNLLVAGTNSTNIAGGPIGNLEVSSDMFSGFPVGLGVLSNLGFINPFTAELNGAPTRIAVQQIWGALNQLSYFSSDNSAAIKLNGYIGSASPTTSVFSLQAAKLGVAGATAPLLATEKFINFGSYWQEWADGSMATGGYLAFDSSLVYPTTAVNYIVNLSHILTFNTETGGQDQWTFGGTYGGRFATPASVSITGTDIVAQFAVGNDYTDTYQFGRANTLVYLSNTFATTTGALRTFTGKAIATNTGNSTATIAGVNGSAILDSASFNNSSTYGGFFDARSQKTGGTVGQLTGVRGGISISTTNASNITQANGVSGTVSFAATAAGGGGTTTLARAGYFTFTKDASDLTTIPEGAGVYTESFIFSNLPIYSGFRMKTNLGINSIQAFYGINIDTLNAGQVDNIGIYVGAPSSGSGKNLAMWLAGTSRLDGRQIVGRTAQGAGNLVIVATDMIYYVGKTAITGGGDTVTLPSAVLATVGSVYTVKDEAGNAATNNITVNSTSGNIDGAASKVMNVNYQSMSFITDGTNWFII